VKENQIDVGRSSPLATYYCQKCGLTISPEDKICPNCSADLSLVGRKITITLEATAHIRPEVTAELTPEERTFLERFHEWLRRNWTPWTLSSIELGFPSGITLVFTRRENEAKSKTTPKTSR